MLQKLSVSNYIYIRQLEINFNQGLTVITGETGAGKSILLGALSLILGQRADISTLLDPDNKCIIEGVFKVDGLNLEAFFTANNLDFDHHCILRREITPAGKSRSFINDTPVSLGVLKDLGDQLINIHSQRQTAEVRNNVFQSEIFDSYAGISSILDHYKTEFHHWNEMKSRLDKLIHEHSKSVREKDYLKFQVDELIQARLLSGEVEALESEFKILSHTDEIKNGLLHAIDVLDISESNALSQLNIARNALKSLARFNNQITEMFDRINVIYIEAKDIVSALKQFEGLLVSDPERLALISDRMNLLNKLQHKHQAGSIDELISLKEGLEQKLLSIDDSESEIQQLKSEIEKQETILWVQAHEITRLRTMAIEPFSDEMVRIIKQLGIPDGVFQVDIQSGNKLNQTGADDIIFLFSASSAIDAKELSKIASGGELSRITLALKSLISSKNMIPSIIFDEIDTGVSGEIAGKVGNILLEMSTNMQVIAITHLPQIAAKGNQHFLVTKINSVNGPSTIIDELKQHERIVNIAKMISDAEVTESAIATARELLNIPKNEQKL